jgi:cation transport regulator ChaB
MVGFRMPYTKNSDLPLAVKNSLPPEAQTLWRVVANRALQQYSDNEKAFATAWAALRNSGWLKEQGRWIKKEQPTLSNVHVNAPLGSKKEKFEFKISKTNEEKQLCFGWAIISRGSSGEEISDLQNDCIDPSELENLAYKHVILYRDAGEQHVGKGGKGILVESVVTTIEKQIVWGITSSFIPVGWWVGFKVTDKEVWAKIKNGTYKAFSIQGDAYRQEV